MDRSMAAAAADLQWQNGYTVRLFDSEEDLAAGLANYIAGVSRDSTKSAFTVVLSGGYLIRCLRNLAEPPHLDGVEWSKWHIFWVDERVVKKTDDDSNYRLAVNGFLSKVGIPANQVYSINDELPPEGAADDYEAQLKNLVARGVLRVSPATGFPRFDLMLLGMGPDGHLASLFPGHPLLQERRRWVTFITDSPKPPPRRITFTFPVIDASEYIAMVVSGDGETDAIARALGRSGGGDSMPLPVQMVKLEGGEFTWFLDKAAAAKLPGDAPAA